MERTAEFNPFDARTYWLLHICQSLRLNGRFQKGTDKWKDITTSSDPLYVIYQPPAAALRLYLSLVHISTVGAAGKTKPATKDAIAEAVFKQFEPLMLKTAPATNEKGEQIGEKLLHYYGNWGIRWTGNTDQITAQGTTQLLANQDGLCQMWSQLVSRYTQGRDHLYQRGSSIDRVKIIDE